MAERSEVDRITVKNKKGKITIELGFRWNLRYSFKTRTSRYHYGGPSLKVEISRSYLRGTSPCFVVKIKSASGEWVSANAFELAIRTTLALDDYFQALLGKSINLYKATLFDSFGTSEGVDYKSNGLIYLRMYVQIAKIPRYKRVSGRQIAFLLAQMMHSEFKTAQTPAEHPFTVAMFNHALVRPKKKPEKKQ